MATTTQNDNRAKFLELRKQGISVADARNQTYGPPPVVPDATPEPTTPVAPVTPPTAPTVTGVDGQQFVQAPVDPTTGLSKPLEPVAQPAPVTQIQAEVKSPEPIKTEVASSTAKTEPVIDYNVSAGREGEIQDNIAKITQTNPKLLKDRNAYNQAFGYETADAGKKALLDSTFSGQVKPSQDDIFNSMRQGVSVGDPKSTEFRQAQARINTFKKFSVYDTASLATSLQSGDLLVGTKAYNDLVSDPTMALKIQKAQAFNKGVVDLVKTGETQMANVLAQNPTVAQALEDGNLSKAEYDQLTNNAEVSAQGKLVETNKTKYETIKAQYDAVEDDVDSEYAGKEVTDSFKAKIVADRRKGMYKDYQIASLEYQNSLGTYTNLKADSTALLAQNMELYKTEQANKAEIAKEDRAMQNALALSQAQFDQKLAQQTQLTNDPTTAITTMIDEYKKLGVPFSRSTQQVISDFQTSGKDLPTYLSELQGLIQSKPEYKRYQAIQQGQMSDAEKMKATQAFQTQSDIRNFAQQKELAKYNNDLNRQEFLFKIENDPEQKAKTAELEAKLNANKSLFDVLGKNVGTYEGNRGYDLAGSLGDPLPAGGNWTVKSIDTAGEQVGSIFIGGKGSKPWGNTVVMQDENGNEIRYSHLQDIGVKPGDVLGFGDIVGTRGNTGNVKGANGETLTAEQLKAGRGAHLDVEIKSNGKLLSNADQVSFLKGLKAGGDQALTDKQFTQYNQTKTGFKSEPIVKSFEEALIAGGDIIQSLGSENGPGDVGAVFNFMKSLDPNSTVREGEFALAAKSAGVWESFKNIPANKLEGTILTDKQRKDFGKLAMKYIESKGKLYDTKYNDMIKVLENQGVPKSYYPTRMTDYVNQYKGTQETTPTSDDPFGIR